MKRAIISLLIILACTPGAMAAPAVKLKLSLVSGSKLHYTRQGKLSLKKNGKPTSQILSGQRTIYIDHCNPSSCIYSATKDGTRLNVEATIAHDGTILNVDSKNESPYNMGYALSTLAKTFSVFHGVEFEPGKAKACEVKWGDKFDLSYTLKTALKELMTVSCKLIKIEKRGSSDYVVIKYEHTIKGMIGNIDAKSEGEMQFDRTTGILIRDEEKIIGENLPQHIEALELSGTVQLDSQRSVIIEPPSALREP